MFSRKTSTYSGLWCQRKTTQFRLENENSEPQMWDKHGLFVVRVIRNLSNIFLQVTELIRSNEPLQRRDTASTEDQHKRFGSTLCICYESFAFFVKRTNCCKMPLCSDPVNPLTPDMKEQILLSCPRIFLIKVLGRTEVISHDLSGSICIDITKRHLIMMLITVRA